MSSYDFRIPVLDARAWAGPVRRTVWMNLYATALLSPLVKNVTSAKVSKPVRQWTIPLLDKLLNSENQLAQLERTS